MTNSTIWKGPQQQAYSVDVFLLLIALLFIVIIYGFDKKECWKLKQNFQFAASLPGQSILLSIFDSILIACNYKNLLDCVLANTMKYDTPSRFMLGMDIYILLSKPEDYKIVLTNVNGVDKSSVTKMWEVFLGDGIIRTSGASHKIRRKLIQPTLNTKYLNEYVTLFDNYSNCCASYIKKEINGHTFDVKPYIARYAVDIYLAYKGEYDELWCWQEKLMKQIFSRMLKPWLYPESIFSLSENAKQTRIAKKIIQDFLDSTMSTNFANNTLIYDTEYEFFEDKQSQASNSVFCNYLKRLKQHDCDIKEKNSRVSDENFADDICNLYAAIQNTITELTSSVLLMLSMHSEVQEKLRQEILLTFGTDNVDAKRLTNMRYLHMIIQETLRLFPTSPVISRQLTGDVELESCTLPNGSYIMIPVFAIHRNPEYWHDPEKFLPERFSPENSSSRHQYVYVPFGIGPRSCLGQRYTFLSVATIIVNLVRQFRFVSTETLTDIKLSTDIILRCQDGVKVSVFHI
ncbi:cytochrome P450 4C1-like isoform X2 [Pseudomyrmex gracilis]|uniref:cytochrome P450 4C1-like isoform X2 n=1 Tax=Pseudomyrmex gracilis TaxID=219809 RepID=UPI000995AC27|nr:cytochrome P450 4C1-like isoform X2 [Pseudomyrmex gracilis]